MLRYLGPGVLLLRGRARPAAGLPCHWCGGCQPAGLLPEQDLALARLARQQEPQPRRSHLSCPAVSQICNVVCSPSTSSCFIWKSTPARRDNQVLLLCVCPGWVPRVLGGVPRVLEMSLLNSFVQRRSRKLDFPVPPSPASTSRYIGQGGAGSSLPSHPW